MGKENQASNIDTLWFTRCAGNGRGGVPTATGIAYQLGWFHEEFKRDGFRLRTLQDDDAREFRHNHYDHQLPTLIREGGNIFSIPARAQGAKTRLIGLTWIDEGQSILVRQDSDIHSAADLKGKRLALPVYRAEDIAENKRGRSTARHHAIHGYDGALRSAGLTFDDVTLIEVGSPDNDGAEVRPNGDGAWFGFQALQDGEVDGFFVKGASAQDAARRHGFRVGVDLDKIPDRRFRVNNGTPRPITVHEYLLEHHHDLVVRFLRQVLRAAEWAKTNLEGVYDQLAKEIGATREGLGAAYKNGFHLALAPDLSHERVELFRRQKALLLRHGVLDRDFDLDAWIDRGPIEEAARTLESSRRRPVSPAGDPAQVAT
jgi:ABC-type nitrate/sulfonate/bicarbonate transport system substrate-binding protein